MRPPLQAIEFYERALNNLGSALAAVRRAEACAAQILAALDIEAADFATNNHEIYLSYFGNVFR